VIANTVRFLRQEEAVAYPAPGLPTRFPRRDEKDSGWARVAQGTLNRCGSFATSAAIHRVRFISPALITGRSNATGFCGQLVCPHKRDNTEGRKVTVAVVHGRITARARG
jgi:hypothetical protein